MAALLCVDFGERRIGLAVSDPERILSTPLVTIDTRRSRDPLGEIKDYIKEEYSVDKIVIGYPYLPDGTVGEKAKAVDAFILKLNERMPEVPIERFDESYSSSDALELLRGSGYGRGRRRDKKEIDRAAAALILQEYMENHKE